MQKGSILQCSSSKRHFKMCRPSSTPDTESECFHHNSFLFDKFNTFPTHLNKNFFVCSDLESKNEIKSSTFTVFWIQDISFDCLLCELWLCFRKSHATIARRRRRRLLINSYCLIMEGNKWLTVPLVTCDWMILVSYSLWCLISQWQIKWSVRPLQDYLSQNKHENIK